jgi:hypothetical protein
MRLKHMKRGLLALLLIAAITGLAGCADSNPRGQIGESPSTLPESEAVLTGHATHLSPYTMVTTGCVPPEDLDPDGSVSSDDPPICSDPKTAPLGTVLVEAEPESPTGDKISVTIGKGTPIFVEDKTEGERELTAVGFAQLAIGMRVEAGYSGPVMESYPMQTTADYVVILDTNS